LGWKRCARAAAAGGPIHRPRLPFEESGDLRRVDLEGLALVRMVTPVRPGTVAMLCGAHKAS